MLIVCSCNNNDEKIEMDCAGNKQMDNWITESFKSNYSIQFPSNYIGHGMIGFEGYTFSKIRSDSLVDFRYFYCSSGFYCEDFGDSLSDPLPSSIFAYNWNYNEEVELTKQVLFCENEDVTALLYYNIEEMAVGKLYMNIDGFYWEAVSVFYDINAYQEVKNILKTIKLD